MIRARALNLAGSSDTSNIIILQTNSEEAVGELTYSGAATAALWSAPLAATLVSFGAAVETARLTL